MSKADWRFRPSEVRRLFQVVATLGKTPIGIEISADGAIKVLLATEPEILPTPGCKHEQTCTIHGAG